ncbi:hypothetical protein EC991_000702 [Linnemannia zychae]|nr:hypothetical protein EC991_000702 [Linnemannia zychae]
MLQAAPSKDGKHFVTGGNRDNPGAISHIYSIDSRKWTTPANLTDLTGYKRSNVAMALDKVTGMIYIVGGFQMAGFSQELSILDTSSTDATKMNWVYSRNQTVIPGLYDPFATYLPTVSKTLVFGGCHTLGLNGFVSACYPLSSGFLLSGGQTGVGPTIESRALDRAPLPRYQSCRVVLPDGNVFIQGGKDPSVFYSDAWILDVTDWTWSSVQINGPVMEMTRAGHTCQLGAYGQIIVVGGYFQKSTTSMYVTPNIAVIDTATWTWKKSYNGGPLDCIWPNPCPAPNGGGGGSGNGGNNGSNGPDGGESSGLSAGAKGGIGAGVGLVLLAAGIFGFIFWRRRRSSLPKAAHDQKGNFTSRTSHGRDGAGLEKDTTGLGGSSPVSSAPPRGPSYVSPPRLTVQAVHPQDSAFETSERASPTMTTLPIYTGYLPDGETHNNEIVSTPSPTVTKKHSFFGIPKKSSKSNLGGNNGGVGSSNSGSVGTDAALAAALLKAEDKVSASSWSPNNHQGTLSDQKDPIPFQQMSVNHVRVPSTKNHNKPRLDTIESSHSGSSASTNSSRRAPTIHTAIKPSPTTPRHIAGPQSLVPEEEAQYFRFSPGIPVRAMTAQDMGQDGLYPPLTPTRGYGPSSILVGTTGPETPTTSLAMSPLQHTTMMAFPDIIAMGTQPQPGHPGAIGGPTRASAYFGQSAQVGQSIGGDNSNNNGYNSNDIPQTPTFRDAQTVKVDEIAREIESQTSSEPKGPQALVSLPPGSRPNNPSFSPPPLSPRPNASISPPLRPRPPQH